MGTKMKGLLKGLRYISQIFDDEKEPEMQIGFPTDVKHVAHIGRDGPAVDSPSWMKDFNSPPGFQSGPLNINQEVKDNPEIKWVSEDSRRTSSQGQNKAAKEPTRMQDDSLTSESITRDPSAKSRQSRRNQSTTKDSLDTTKPDQQESSLGSESPSRNLPDIPKKSRRKKSKESPTTSGGSTRSRRSKAPISSTYTSPFSDPGPERGSMFMCKTVREEEKEGT